MCTIPFVTDTVMNILKKAIMNPKKKNEKDLDGINAEIIKIAILLHLYEFGESSIFGRLQKQQLFTKKSKNYIQKIIVR